MGLELGLVLLAHRLPPGEHLFTISASLGRKRDESRPLGVDLLCNLTEVAQVFLEGDTSGFCVDAVEQVEEVYVLLSGELRGVDGGDTLGSPVLVDLVLEHDVLLHVEQAVGIGIGCCELGAVLLGDLLLTQLRHAVLSVLGLILFAEALRPADEVAGGDGGVPVDNILSSLNHFAL